MVRASQKRSTRDATYADAVVAEHRRTATVQGLWLVGRSRSRSRSDRLWNADQAFLRRGHGHTEGAGPLGHDVSRNPVAR